MKRILTPFERRELRMIERLQSMNIYPQLVRKLTEGESARSVARWAISVGVEGAPGQWGSEYWLKHLSVLRRQVIEAKDKLRTNLSPCGKPRQGTVPQPPVPEAVLAKVQDKVEELSLFDFIHEDALKVMRHVIAADKQLKAMHLLTYAALTQIGRVEQVKKMEKTLPFMLPNGHQEIKRLNEIANSLLRLELGHEMIRGRRGYMPQVPTNDAEMSPFAKRLMEFDPVDRSILRELTVNFIDMLEGRVPGLEADTTGGSGDVCREQPGTVEPPVGEGN